MLDFPFIIWSKGITFCSLHCLIWLWTVLHGRGTRDTCSQLGQNVSRHCMFPLAGVHPLIVTHHTDQFQVGFSLCYCHLDHWTGTLPSQHHHGHTIGDCAAFPVRQRDNGWEIECETERQETVHRCVNIRRSGLANTWSPSCLKHLKTSWLREETLKIMVVSSLLKLFKTKNDKQKETRSPRE